MTFRLCKTAILNLTNLALICQYLLTVEANKPSGNERFCGKSVC